MIGHRVGAYVIESEVAIGGFAIVYRARDASGREVALKVLLAEHIGSRAVERFEREVAIIRSLRHPSLVELLDAGRLPDGRPYCAMELLHGHDLGGIGRVPAARVVEIIAAVGGALAVAHAAGIVHRDINPNNVVVCDDGRVVLLDFGIAKLLADDAGLTVSRQTLGTAGAMAPEQLTAGTVDARTDIYALGVLAYELLCGEPPFAGAAAAQLHRFAQRPRPSVCGAPAVFDPIIARAMAIRPVDRYPHVGELVDALRAAIGDAQRARGRAIAIHVDGVAAPAELAAASARLASRGFRPLALARTTAAYWRAAEHAGDLAALAEALTARGLHVAIHVDQLETRAGQAEGGPLAELWRWVPAQPATPLVLSEAARDILGVP